MTYIVANALLVFIFTFLFVYSDKRVQFDSLSGNVFIVPLVLLIIESLFFTIVIACKTLWVDTITNQLMKVVYSIDGIIFVELSFAYIGLATNVKKFWLRALQFALCVASVAMVYVCYDYVEMTKNYGIVIESNYMFSGDARKYFPWTWVMLHTFLFKFLLPVFCYLFMVLIQEKKGSQLQRYQGLLVGESFVLLWLTRFFLKYMETAEPAFATLFIYASLVMFVLLVLAVSKATIPSGKSVFAALVRAIFAYVLPAFAVGAIAMYVQPHKALADSPFVLILIVIALLSILFSLRLSTIISASSRLYTANYGPALEKDLATIDYSGEMDVVTNRMYEIFRRNVETSKLDVYILGSKGQFEIAYSSNNSTYKIPANNLIFETLLNINKSVVCWSQIGNEHDIAEIDDDLAQFFKDTNSDALFILNEGHNILGLITLGKKVSGDHYKEYDYNVFTGLFSYFFVFGYYMRNISNKDIIGTVNREIRMSSQIITSIQENIDHIKDPKIDTGYLMVPAHNIGGEFIDLIRLTDKRHLFVVGDLSGRGIAASMNMVILKSIIRTYLAETHDFKELVVKLNRFVRDSLRKGTVFAGLFALIDFETDTMYYINCGIPALMLYTQVYNNVIEIQGSGHILGFVKDISPFISVKSTKLSPGDIILTCTDGLVDSHSLRGEQFGKERIQQCLLDNSTYPAQRMAQFTFDSLVKFMSKEMEDDVSILVMKYESKYETLDDAISAQTESSEPVIDSQLQAGDAEEFVPEEEPVNDSAAENEVENKNEEPVVEEPAVDTPEPAVEESPAVAEDMPAGDNSMGDMPFDDPEIPDLSNLDEMLKMAGL